MQNTQIVPWYDSAEWLRVYSALFGPDTSKASKDAALSTLLAWKARQPSLVSGVESTLSLLEVETQTEYSNERVLRLAYSAAIMRFVNHMLDTEQSKGMTLYRAARKADLPDWVIDMRHSAAHGDSLPSLDLLRRASSVALNWLFKNYWEPQRESISDFIVTEKSISEEEERRLSRMISFCASLSICSRGEPKIKQIKDLPSIELKESIAEEARELLAHDITNNSITLKNLILLLKTQLNKMIKSRNTNSIISKTLLDENSLFLSLEVLQLFDENLFTKNGLSPEYVRSWDVLLEIIHANNVLVELVEELIRVSEDSTKLDAVRKLAALWVREILRGLKRVQLYKAKLKKLKSSGELENLCKKKNHKTIFKELFPNDNHGLTLSLTKLAPEQLCSASFIHPIVKSYNPYLHLFIEDLLVLQVPRLDSFKRDRLIKLAKLISGRGVPESNAQQVFTVNEAENKKEINSSDSDCVEVEIYEDSGVWKIASDEHDWSNCPLGVLPWQLKSAQV